MTSLLAGLAVAGASVGVVQALTASWLVKGFVGRPRAAAVTRPAVTVLKPLHGDEPLLEDALATLCRQDYPAWQIIFGVQDAADPAVEVVGRLRTRFPGCDITLVVDATEHGANRKVGNLINMLRAATHGILVIADSDVHVRADYLERLVSALEQRGIGLVTTLYAGLPAWRNLSARLGAMQISYGFLPGAVLARAMGRQDCLGATMCLRRRDLTRIGGFASLVGHLADDNVLGRRIRGLGLHVALANTIPLTTVPEARLGALLRHELRWARTIRTLEPLGFAASVLQYPLVWALLSVLLSQGAFWSLGLFAVCWALRGLAALDVDRALAGEWRGDDKVGLAFCCPVWLLPLRDVLSVAVMLASYAGRRVDWRGHVLHADTPARSDPFRPIEGINKR